MIPQLLTRLMTVAALTLASVTLAACGSEPTGEATVAPIPGPSSSSAQSSEVLELGDGSFPSVTEADRSSADSTAETAAKIMHSWDTTVDRTETAAAIRAIPLMSAEWAKNQVEPERNASQGEWLKPSEHQAYSLALVTPVTGDVRRDIGDDKAIRAYDVSWRWVPRDGVTITETGRRQITLYLEKHEGEWQVVGHQARDMPAIGGGSAL